MNVLMVTPSYYPIKGGAESVIENLASNLNQVGIVADVLTFNMNCKWKPRWKLKTEEVDGVKVIKIPAFNWFPITHSDRITQGINLIPGMFRNYLNEYDIVHFHVGDLTFPVFSMGTKTPKILQFHGTIGYYKRNFVVKLMLNKIANEFISISKIMQKELVEIGVQQNKINYLPNAVNSDIFFPSGDKEENLVLFVGRITFDKGLHVLIKSFRLIKKKTHLVIIGPADFDHEYFQDIQKQILNENKKGPHVITYVGEQEQAIIVKWCQRASILVLPSFREASSIVSLEALSCKTPVVATNVGGVPEIVRNGKTGILVHPNNVKELANAIIYLLENRDKRALFGSRGRQMVEEEFSYKIATKKLQGIYEEILRN